MAEMINLKSSKRIEMVDITAPVQKVVSQHDLKDGLCVVYVPHTTAGLTINEGADPAVCRDLLTKLSELIPPDADYQHMEGNSDSHIKASLVGSSVKIGRASCRERV
jgi:secondary thiamine-phosphate synthase enzyme